jgi:hypothetical protein
MAMSSLKGAKDMFLVAFYVVDEWLEQDWF